eukprot:TRINITY_DN14897_c0_g1_i6.p1 TRINITY_DN14897_c0_g1~~TRINITY_DN14897_c0_g1_i6.p1  ORF type:complete len:432 (+),score=109.30 TRINITY_DN14897_c0_g1_i6:87-1382(+)
MRQSLGAVAAAASPFLLLQSVDALDNGVARTPPMGWLSWERYACNVDCEKMPGNCINAQLYMDMADRMVADGWKEAGYEYVNVDDCWPASSRDAQGLIQADEKRFPGGIKALCDYIHSKGLKCGLYTDIGATTCGGYLALNVTADRSNSEFVKEIGNFASWGIDSLKVDGCNQDPKVMNITYPRLSNVLVEAGRLKQRPIMYSCSWPAYISIPGQNISKEVYDDLAKYCNIWRNYRDIVDTWDSYWNDNQDMMAEAAGPGHFNDPDMILAGNTGLSIYEYQAQFVLWSIFAAPLLMSNDLRTIDDEAKKLLQNPDIIKVNQDPLGKQGKRVGGHPDSTSIWARPLVGGDVAVAFLNEVPGVPGTPRNVSVTAKMAGLGSKQFTVYDLLQREKVAGGKAFVGEWTAVVPANGVRFVRLSPVANAAEEVSVLV